MPTRLKGKIGSSLKGFLKAEGILEKTSARALKSILALQIQNAMQAKKISKKELASRMRTSRTQVDRLLDPKNDKVSLETIYRAAFAVGKQVHISLEDDH